MADLLSIPENVLIQHLFPCLDHNDLLRLRRVSRQTKDWADAYLWTPQKGHQGNWVLKIDSSKEDQTLEVFLQKGLPPPSRLHIANRAENDPSEIKSFFEDKHLDEFMRGYSKHVTHLRVDKLFIPFTSAQEIGFYESLINLEELICNEMVTVGGTAQFEEKARRAEWCFLIRPNWSIKLKIFKLTSTDCMDSMWTFINGLSNNLEELLHPFQQRGGSRLVLNTTSFAPVRELIERRGGGMRSSRKLVYDWRYMWKAEPMELLRVFACCYDHGVIIKKLGARHLNCLLVDENGRIDEDEVVDPLTGEWTSNFRMKIQRNQFVGSVIHSLFGVTDNVFLIDLPALEEIDIFESELDDFRIRPRSGYGFPRWPNLRKMDVQLEHCAESDLRFLCEMMKRSKLEELCLSYRRYWSVDLWKVPFPKNLASCCGNVKKLTVNCPWTNPFFVSLWEGLPLLEDVTLSQCWKLTDRGFVGYGVAGSRPVFLNLKKLKHLSIKNLEAMPKITDEVFRQVLRHIKLTTFKLSSNEVIKKITVVGIKELLTGPFSETIEKLNLDELKLENASEEELKEVVSCFRCSKMI